VVCLSVGRSDAIVSPAKTAELIETSFGMWTRVGRRNHVLHEVKIPRHEGAILRGVGAARKVVKYAALKRLNRTRYRLGYGLGNQLLDRGPDHPHAKRQFSG